MHGTVQEPAALQEDLLERIRRSVPQVESREW